MAQDMIRSALVRMMGEASAMAWELSTVNVRQSVRELEGSGRGSIERYFLGSLCTAYGVYPDAMEGRGEECFEDILSESLVKSMTDYTPNHESHAQYPTLLFKYLKQAALNWARSESARRRREMSSQEFADRDGVGIGSATDNLFAKNGRMVKIETSEDSEYVRAMIRPIMADLSDRDREYIQRTRIQGEENGSVCRDMGISAGRGSQIWAAFAKRVKEKMEGQTV